MKKYLFLFTITPVQSFISQARKTRDMFSGSKLLSQLINESLEQLPTNSKIIFPDEKLDSKPNRFVAELEVKNGNEIIELGNKLTENVKQHFCKIGDKCFNDQLGENTTKPNYFKSQLKKFLYPYWASVEIADKDYPTSYKVLEATLGAAKNIKEFRQTNEEGARKCSVCGEHSALFYGGNGDNKARYNYQTDAVVGVKDLLQNEGLCAICFTKRFYTTDKYPSTANIATMDKVVKIKEDDSYKTYKRIFNGSYNHQLLYEENLTKKYFDKNKISANVNEVNRTFSELKKILEKNKLSNFSKYYALIMFDGDSMGKWLSGINLKDGVELKEFHKKLTSAIGLFADKAKEILKEPKGKIVFAGGEDFMGFVNLTSLFDVVTKLRVEYDLIINQNLKEYKNDEANLTFSAGIVITHYKLPLSEVINWARKLEKSAKDLSDNKNAFSLAVLKHSGEIHQTSYKWGTTDNLTENFETIGYLAKKLSDEVFSNTFITNLRKEMMLLIGADKEDISPIVIAELGRLIKKSFMFIKTTETQAEFNDIKKNEITTMQKRLEKMIVESGKDLENFFFALEIADFIHRKIEGGE